MSAFHVVDEIAVFVKDWETWNKLYHTESESLGDSPTRENWRILGERFHAVHPEPTVPRGIRIDLGISNLGTVGHFLRDGYFSKYKVVVFKEKHGDRCFAVPPGDQEAHGRIALNIVKERNESGFYEENEPEAPESPELTKESAQVLPDRYRELVMEEWDEYEKAVKYHKKVVASHNVLVQALKGDPLAAVQFLRSNKDAQYDGFEVIVPEEA